MRKLLPFLLLFFLLPGTASAAERAAPSWGLDRLDDEATLDGYFRSQFTGQGVDVYMLDSGIGTHSELAGKVQDGWSAWGDNGRSDCSGQGTASAVLAAGNTYGVAPGATLYPVRALDCNAEATAINIKNGIDWVTAHHTTRPAVLVVGGAVPLNEEVDDAAAALMAEGVLVVAAAGDVFADVCTRSPAAASGALAVGAVDSSLQRAIFSGFGECLDIWAPGKDLLVAEEGSPVPVSRNGTALSASLAGGLAALFLERRPAATAAEVRTGLLERARTGVGDIISSPDRLLFAADLAYKPGTSSYWEPVVVSPPAWTEASSQTWSLRDGYYSDAQTNGTWIRGPIVGGTYESELVCQLRTQAGTVLLSQTQSGEAEPTSCSLAFGTLEDGVYRFVVRKDLVSGQTRIQGRERSLRFELDRHGPQVAWGEVPEFARETIIELPLQVYDRREIDGISVGDFHHEGTADCLLTPLVYSLPAGGGEFRVRALCSSEGTLRPLVRAAAFNSADRPGPSQTVRAGQTIVDWTAPDTQILSGPPASSTAKEASFRFRSTETTGGLQCRIDFAAWQSCPTEWTSPALAPGNYTLDVRAIDGAGNVDSSPASWRWEVLAPPPPQTPPANDNFQDAQQIELPGTWKTNNQFATRQSGEPKHGSASVWYRWSAPSGGRVQLSTRGSSFDTRLLLYRGDSLGSLQKVADNDDWGSELWSRLRARVQGGTTYYIAVTSSRNTRGALQLAGSLSSLGQSPTSSYMKAVKRFPRKGVVRMWIGVAKREAGQNLAVQCAQRVGRVPIRWKRCTLSPVFRGLRRGRTYQLLVRLVVDGTPEKEPTTLRVGF